MEKREGVGQISGEVGSLGDITRVTRTENGEKEEVKFREEVGREEEVKEGEFWVGSGQRREEKMGGGIKEEGWEENVCGEERKREGVGEAQEHEEK